MSIRPLDEQKCPVDIQMFIGHIAEVLDMYDSISLPQFSFLILLVVPKQDIVHTLCRGVAGSSSQVLSMVLNISG